MSLPVISPRHVSAAARGCLVWGEEPLPKKDHHHHHHHSRHRSHSGRRHHRENESSTNEKQEQKEVKPYTPREGKSHSHHHRHHHNSSPNNNEQQRSKSATAAGSRKETTVARYANAANPPNLSVLHQAGGHEHDSNEGIKQSIMVERHSGGRIYAFPAWGGAGGGYYSCFNYKGGNDARGRYDGAFDIIPTKDTQGRRRVIEHDQLTSGANASSFVPVEKPQGLKAVRPPQRETPMDGQSGRGLHQDIGLLNVEPRPSRKKMIGELFNWQKNSFNVMTEAQAPTDTRTNFQIIADAKREKNRQAKRDFLAHLKSEGQFRAVNRVPIRSTLTQRRWDSTTGGELQPHQQQYENVTPVVNNIHHASPPNVNSMSAAGGGSGGNSNNKNVVFNSLSPRAKKFLASGGGR